MKSANLKLTYIGGPTALLEINGLRLLTDPTFDPAGEEYVTGVYTLRKRIGPAVSASSLDPVDVILLSHDHHFDNLDREGRRFLPNAGKVITTPAGAERLGNHAIGLADGETLELPLPKKGRLRISGTPARHGAVGADRGPVTGFVLASTESSPGAVYVSGDTVWYEGVVEVSRRFDVRVALLFMGAARVPEVGPHHLTFTAREAVEAAHAFPNATIVPLHYEGWAHYFESRPQIEDAFKTAGMVHRLHWLEPGRSTEIEGSAAPDSGPGGT